MARLPHLKAPHSRPLPKILKLTKVKKDSMTAKPSRVNENRESHSNVMNPNLIHNTNPPTNKISDNINSAKAKMCLKIMENQF